MPGDDTRGELPTPVLGPPLPEDSKPPPEGGPIVPPVLRMGLLSRDRFRLLGLPLAPPVRFAEEMEALATLLPDRPTGLRVDGSVV